MDTDVKKDFCHRLKFIIHKKFKNQKNFCSAFNLDEKKLSTHITGRAEPNLETIVLYASYLNESLDWLLTGKITENTRISSYFDLILWDQVVESCIKFITKNKMKLTGRFLLGVYQLLMDNKTKEPNITVEEVLEKNKNLIIN